MSISRLIAKISSIFSESAPAGIPDKLGIDLENYFKENETVISYLPVHTSRCNSDNWSDKNMFYNCLLLLTQRRILICKNSRYLKVFRDLPLIEIKNYNFQLNQKDNHILSFYTEKTEDILTVYNKYSENFSELRHSFSDTVDIMTNTGTIGNKYKICEQCRARLIPDSKFCSNCGKRVKI